MVVRFDSKTDVSILFVADLHLGDEGSAYSNVIQFLKESTDLIVFLGDLVDAGIAGSKGNVHAQEPSVQNQLLMLVEDLKALRGRILCFVAGNHEDRLSKKAGVNLYELLGTALEVPYTSDFVVLDVTTPGSVGSKRRLCYRIAVAHGVAGGRYPEKNMRQGRYFMEMLHNVDAYVLGHTHQPSVYYRNVYVYDDKNKGINERTVLVANVGGFVDAEYARKALFPPTASMLLKMQLLSGEKRLQAGFVQV